MLKKKRSQICSESGLAVLEMIPVIIVVMVLLRYTYGFFGVIHSATLQSIATRNYAFETFRHRSRLVYLRETIIQARSQYKLGVRLHGIRDENSALSGSPFWEVARRDISFPIRDVDRLGTDSYSSRSADLDKIVVGKRYEADGVNPVWLALRYGMCIDFQCGD
jgi:hypothetical protein